MSTSFSNRHHNPKIPIVRTPFEKIFVGTVQFLLVFQSFYFAAKVTRLYGYFDRLYTSPAQALYIPIAFFLGPLVLIIFAKLFNRYIVLTASLAVGAYHTIFDSQSPPQYAIFGYFVVLVIIEGWKPYKGGEYHKGDHIFSQLGRSLLVLAFLVPIIFFGFQFDPNFDFSPYDIKLIRLYLAIAFSLSHLIVVFPAWLCFFFLDRKMQPFFPLEKADEAKLHSEGEYEDPHPKYDYESQNYPQPAHSDQEQANNFDDWLPQPGEMYLQVLTHHMIDEDDHTFVIRIGKVRVYFCTRCSAMVLGVIFSFFLFIVVLNDFNVQLDVGIAFWLGTFLPLFPLLDWGLQALQIRKATTPSRLFTGFILGVSMQLIPFAASKHAIYIAIVVAYFAIFGILYYFRVRIAQKHADEEAFSEFLSPEQEVPPDNP